MMRSVPFASRESLNMKSSLNPNSVTVTGTDTPIGNAALMRIAIESSQLLRADQPIELSLIEIEIGVETTTRGINGST